MGYVVRWLDVTRNIIGFVVTLPLAFARLKQSFDCLSWSHFDLSVDMRWWIECILFRPAELGLRVDSRLQKILLEMYLVPMYTSSRLMFLLFPFLPHQQNPRLFCLRNCFIVKPMITSFKGIKSSMTYYDCSLTSLAVSLSIVRQCLAGGIPLRFF